MPKCNNPRLTLHEGVLKVTYENESGERRRWSTGTADRPLAERRMAEFLLQKEKEDADKVDSLLDAYLKHLDGRAWKSSAEHQVKPLRVAFGHLAPMEISESAIKSYVASRASLGRAQQTIRNEVSLLASALNHAKKRGIIPERPHIAFPQGSPPRELYLTHEQARKLEAAAVSPHVRLFIVAALTTGARAAAILDLTWDRVDLERRTIDLRLTAQVRMKGRAVVPINDKLLPLLKEAYDVRTCDHVIEHHGEQLKRISKGFKETAKRAGLPWASPHVLRHTAAVWMAESGSQMTEIAAYLGHRDSAITERVYAKFSPTHLRSAGNSLVW